MSKQSAKSGGEGACVYYFVNKYKHRQT